MPGPVAAYRERDGRYYFINAEDASAFMDLALRASFPIDEAAAEQGYYLLTIAAVTQEAPQSNSSLPVVRLSFPALSPMAEACSARR